MTYDMKKYTAALALAILLPVAPTTLAQNNGGKELNKVITLDKDFVPVEKKAVKKNKLPQVVKNDVKEVKAPTYSTWVQPTNVPSLVPLMEPYGYRTLHNFSDQNGYLVVGAGSHLNMIGSVGYRFIDREDLRVGAWLQHNSTWNGKNNSPLNLADDPQKQKYNDNLLGIDLVKELRKGTFGASIRGEYDSFNYYGGWTDFLRNNKQSFFNVDLDFDWDGKADVGDGLDYKVDFGGAVAGYGKGLEGENTGAREVQARVGLGADYSLGDFNTVGADLGFTLVNLSHYDTFMAHDNLSDTYGMLHLSPHYRFQGDNFRALIGLNLDFSFNDGKAVRVSPNVKFEYDVAGSTVIYANATGGKELNTLASIHAFNRYSAPRQRIVSSYTPLDVEGGLKFGPFRGFYLKVFAGYGIFRGALDPFVQPLNVDGLTGVVIYPEELRFAAINYRSTNYRGVKVGAEVSYKYRSLAELSADIVYAPAKDNNDMANAKYLNGYSLNYNDGPGIVANINLKVTPTDKLAIGAGVEYRGQRAVLQAASGIPYGFLDLNDVWNLKAHASYNFSKTFSVWLDANNLLNRKWDEMPGMGAQKLSVMGGVAINF